MMGAIRQPAMRAYRLGHPPRLIHSTLRIEDVAYSRPACQPIGLTYPPDGAADRLPSPSPFRASPTRQHSKEQNMIAVTLPEGSSDPHDRPGRDDDDRIKPAQAGGRSYPRRAQPNDRLHNHLNSNCSTSTLRGGAPDALSCILQRRITPKPESAMVIPGAHLLAR
jgi:hypothetical protein